MLYRMTTKVCKVHFVRDILGHVRKNDGKRVLALLRGITESPTLELAQRNLGEAVKALALKMRDSNLQNILYLTLPAPTE